MANLFFTGFENVSDTSTQIPIFQGVNGLSTTTPFSSGKSYSPSYSGFAVPLTSNTNDTIIFGGAFYFYNWGYSDVLLIFHSAGVDTAGVRLRVFDRSSSGATLGVWASTAFYDTGTLLGSSTVDLIKLNTWHYIEMRVKTNSTSGEVEVRVDGSTVINASNVNTQVGLGAGSAITRLTCYEVAQKYIDDVYINDGAGSAPHNTFYGQVRVDAVIPSSDNSVQFTPSTGANNYAMVDDGASPDDDSTYNASSTANHKDLLGLSGYSLPPSSSGGILGVNVDVRAKRQDAGIRKMKTVVKSSTTEVTGSEYALTSAYATRRTTLYTDPATSTAFANATAVNNLKVGYTISV